jgi:hypothetical protein
MTINGYLTDSDTAAAISVSVGLACDARGLPRFIGITPMPIYAGTHKGKMFLPLSDMALEQVLWRGVKMKDFPEFQQIIDALGGLSARVTIQASSLIDPDATTEP